MAVCDLCVCEYEEIDMIFFNVDDVNDVSDDRAVCTDCILKIDKVRKYMDYNEAKKRAEMAEIAAINAREKRRELIRKNRELNNDYANDADQELDVLYFTCVVIFIVSAVAFWFGAS
jgi:hypothetical protein